MPKTEAYTLRYLRDNLVHNGIIPSTEDAKNSQYLVTVIQTLHTVQISDFGTFTTNCQLSYKITDSLNRRIIAEFNTNQGPEAGFTTQQAQENCIKEVAPQVSEKLIRELAVIMNNKWSKGYEFQITVQGVPGEYVTTVNNVIQELFQVKSSTHISFDNGILSAKVKYRGTAVNLAEALIGSLDDFDRKIVVAKILGNELQFIWVKN